MDHLIGDLDGCISSGRTLGSILDDALAAGVDPSRPSLLPGWSIGHVLTHLARNADALRQMAEGADLGEARPMYPSAEARAAAIDAGAGRPLSELVADVTEAMRALEATWASLSTTGWAGNGLTQLGALPIADCPWRRRREIEVHAIDLGLAYTAEHWPEDYVAADLARCSAEWVADGKGPMPDDIAAATSCRQLAWLLGR